MGKVKQPHHRGTHQVTARKLTDAAYANPSTRCWRCNLTLLEVRHTKNPKAIWTAGHLIDGQVNGPMRAECSPCNFGAGATLRNKRKRRLGVNGVSRSW